MYPIGCPGAGRPVAGRIGRAGCDRADAHRDGADPPGADDPFLAVKGVRDIRSGLILLALFATEQRRALGWALLASAHCTAIKRTSVPGTANSSALVAPGALKDTSTVRW